MTDSYEFPLVGDYFNPFSPQKNLVDTNEDTTKTSPAEPPASKNPSLMDEAMTNLRQQLHSMDHDLGWTARYFGSPRLTSRSPYYLCPWLESLEVEADVKPGKYMVNISLTTLGKNIGPLDVKVSLLDGVITIKTKKEEVSTDENGNGSVRIYQEYMRTVTLPERVNIKQVKTVMSPEGYITIEAPLPRPETEAEIRGDWDREHNVTSKQSSNIPINGASEESKPSSCLPT